MPKKTRSKRVANSQPPGKGARSEEYIQQLTAERDRLKELLAAVHQELADYQRAVHALMRERVTDEHLEHFAEEEPEREVSIVQLIEQAEQRRGQ